MRYEVIRARLFRAMLLAALLGGAGWGWLRAARLHQLAEGTSAAASSLHARNRDARAAAVVLGGAAMDDSIRAARERFRSLEARVPAAGQGMPAEGVLRLVREAAEREGVEVRDHKADAPVAEGAFSAEGGRFCAVGPYDAVGAWLSRVVSMSRLVQVREVALDPVPDTLLARTAVANPGEASVAPCAVGERPMAVVATVSFRWFLRTSASEEK